MIRWIAGAAMLATAAVAPAAPADDAEDMRCLIVAAQMGDSGDKDVEEAGAIMLFYFLGRIDGRNAGANIEAMLRREAERMTDAEMERLAASCAAQFELRAKQIEAIGSALEKSG